MIVRYTLKRGQPLTPQEIAELEALKDRPIVFDEDCPEMTEEELERLGEITKARNELLIRLGLPLPSEDDDPNNRVQVTDEQWAQIDAFWAEQRARQRAEAIRRREAAEAAQKREAAKKRPVVNQSSLPLARL